MAIGALALASLVLTGVSIQQQVKASHEQRRLADEQLKAQQADRKMAEISNRRQKVEVLRRGRIERARIVAAGESGVAGGSSSIAGGAGSAVSTAAANVGYLNQLNVTAQQIFQSNIRQSGIMRNIGQAQAFASISGTLGTVFRPAVGEFFKESTEATINQQLPTI